MPDAKSSPSSNGIPVVRTFVPEQWGQLDIFTKFYLGTYALNDDVRKALAGISSHFHKATILFDLARKLIPNLALDESQLRSHGFTPAANSKEFSAVVEGVFLELYSAVDCSRKVIVATHRNCRRVPDSTRKMMQRAKDGSIGSDFPRPLIEAMVAAVWYERLLFIRDTLTHSDVGSCRQDPKTGFVSYSHFSMRESGQPLNIPDVMTALQDLSAGVNEFLGKVFHYLNGTLRPHEIDQLCGIFFGRGYLRKLRSDEPINLDAGVCSSRSWFLSEEGYMCPLADSCKAFHRAPAT